jgi:HK97 family phage major capsid protein
MTREERAARVEELRRWIAEQNEEFRDEGFPADVQSAWDQNNLELREHERVTVELEARDTRIAELVKVDDGAERGYDAGGVTRRSAGPQLISRMTERDVYDMSAVKVNPFNPSSAIGEIRDRALRANELSHYAHPEVDQAHAKGHVEKLIRRESFDDDSFESSAVAKRVLLTGNPDYRRAFSKLMSAGMRGQIGMAALTPAELRSIEAVRALSVGSGPGGGFAVPVTLDPTVIPTSNYSVNPFRGVCRVEQITGLVWNGVTAGAITAAYAAEAAVASDNAPVFAQPTMNMIRAQAFVPTSIELTQDWGGIQGEIARLISDAKDDLEATQFTTGAGGTTAPTGIITGATTTVATAGTATFALGDLYLLEQGVPPRFRPRSVMMANRFILNKIRQFDTAGGSGVWFSGESSNGYGGLGSQLANGALTQDAFTRSQLLGYPVYEDTAMAAATTTASKIIVMGDPRYYLIVDRIGMDIELIPHLFNTGTPGLPTGQRGFYAFWRNNANVLSPAAFRVLTVA